MTKKPRLGAFAAKMSEKYDIQPELLLGGCRLELRGRSSLAVGGCRGIIEYSPSIIRLRLRDGKLTVTGESLTCDSYTGGEVLISGRVNIMEFEDKK